MLAILSILVPNMALIALGGLIRGRLTPDVWRGIDTLNYQVLFPALIFTSAAAAPIALSDAAVVGSGVLAIVTVGLGLGWLMRPLGPKQFLDYAGAWQLSYRFNTALAFVAAGALSPETSRLMSIAVGFAIPLANVYAVAGLSRGQGLGLGKALVQIARNPFFLASLSGMLVGLSGLALPALLLAALERLASAAIPIALLAVGATMAWSALLRLNRFAVGITAIKLVALPAIALLTVTVLGLPPEQARVLVVFAALPTSSAGHVLAGAFGANRQLPATLIAQSTVFSALTLPVWMALAVTG